MRKKSVKCNTFSGSCDRGCRNDTLCWPRSCQHTGLQLLLSGNYGDRLCGGNVRRNVPHE